MTTTVNLDLMERLDDLEWSLELLGQIKAEMKKRNTA